MQRGASRATANTLFAALLVPSLAATVLLAVPAASPSATQTSDTISRFLESGQPPLTAYRARRHLEATSRGGKMSGELDAWTTLNSDGRFSFEVLQESGSNLIRQRVLHAALLEEQDNYANDRLAESAFTRDNYDFVLGDAVGEGNLVRISLAPRRRSQVLISGSALVKREDGDLVTIEGILSKRPSFWTRRVEMIRRYARIGGVRVPMEVRLNADVRFVGDSTFAMTYQYATINGQTVATH